jgi:hypothetical protein
MEASSTDLSVPASSTNDKLVEGVTRACCSHCRALSKFHGMSSIPWKPTHTKTGTIPPPPTKGQKQNNPPPNHPPWHGKDDSLYNFTRFIHQQQHPSLLLGS